MHLRGEGSITQFSSQIVTSLNFNWKGLGFRNSLIKVSSAHKAAFLQWIQLAFRMSGVAQENIFFNSVLEFGFHRKRERGSNFTGLNLIGLLLFHISKP